MTEPVNPIIPRNPNIFPVPPVLLPRVSPEEREQRRREREEEEGGPRPRAERRMPQEPTHGDDGHDHVDVRV
ncbi:hypothetical protein [Conexibacter sp. CPCC 206217]|uniref:hypothetical protein n=1 Tax=Conexibacter sp. CPCC 206217 TaxID=3064574 RepID=UPI0027181970|nr:hypothetical protein [Conexibacter sp. CPCC 206217]MDO8211387.1 hypothetical protein [Conexibacter sp. CPCC 206217]